MKLVSVNVKAANVKFVNIKRSFLSTLMLSFALYVAILCSTLMPTSAGVFADDQSEQAKPVILVWGDSLSAAYGIPVEQGWVSLLQNKLKASHKVINGSISGETTIGGLTRFPAALAAHQPDYLLLELGANDGLRGLPTGNMQKNLQQMIELAQEAGAKTVLLGIKIPPNYGMLYTDRFDKVFSDLSENHELPLLPFLLDRVALDYDLMQADGLHPTAEAQPMILENVWGVLESILMSDKAQTKAIPAKQTGTGDQADAKKVSDKKTEEKAE